jgi:hypothetical protein
MIVMIDTLLKKFIKELNQPKGSSPSPLQQETYYAAIQGDSERYIRWKFLNFIYQSKLECSDFTLALESFDRNDMIFKCGENVHFLEWKALTLPVKNQDKAMLHNKRFDNLKQLCKCSVKFEKMKASTGQSLSAQYWSAFLLIDFDDSLITHGTIPTQVKFDRHGNFQKYGNIAKTNSGRALMINPFLSLQQQSPFQGSVRLRFELYNLTTQITQSSTYLSLTPKKSNLLIHKRPWDSPNGDYKNLLEDVFRSAYDEEINLPHIPLNLPNK